MLEDKKTQFETDREVFREEAKKAHADIESERAELEKRNIEISKLEAAAKVGFVEKQREVFKEIIEKHNAELDVRQKELDGLAIQLSTTLKDLYTIKGEIAKRELAVIEREQDIHAGFASKVKALADEAGRQHQANRAEEDLLRKRADAIADERNSLEVAKAELVQREQSVITAEQKRDAGFADERAALDSELRSKRIKMESEIADVRELKLSELEAEMAKLKSNRLEDISNAEGIERDRIRAEISREREAWTNQLGDIRKQLDAERTEFEKQKGALSVLQSEIEAER